MKKEHLTEMDVTISYDDQERARRAGGQLDVLADAFRASPGRMAALEIAIGAGVALLRFIRADGERWDTCLWAHQVARAAVDPAYRAALVRIVLRQVDRRIGRRTLARHGIVLGGRGELLPA